MKIAVASDHAGKDLKQILVEYLRLTDYNILDYGVSFDTSISVDYPDYADIVASEVSTKAVERGILVCGTGIGMSLGANKYPGVRAAVVTDEFTARMSRAHNDANVLCLGSRVINHHRAIEFLKLWLMTEFEEGRHRQRLDKVAEIERRTMKEGP